MVSIFFILTFSRSWLYNLLWIMTAQGSGGDYGFPINVFVTGFPINFHVSSKRYQLEIYSGAITQHILNLT